MFDSGGYATDSSLADLVREGILQMCSQLKPEAVAVADSLAPPDFVLNSVIGKSDGKVCTVETYSNAGLWALVGLHAACRNLGLALGFLNFTERSKWTVLDIS
jgi:hypothetical protein